MKTIYLCAFLLMLSMQMHAQNQLKNFTRTNSIYLELLGHSQKGFALNYDKIFCQKKGLYFSSNLGLTYTRKGNFATNLGLNAIFLQGKHHVEIGSGVGYNQMKYVQEHPFGAVSTTEYSEVQLQTRLGYRYQEPGQSMVVRGGITPSFFMHDGFPPCDNHFFCGLEKYRLIPFVVSFSIGFSF